MISTHDTHRRQSDMDLERRVLNFLNTRQVPALRQVGVEADQGTIVLTGRVSSFYEKQLALSCCSRVAGVIQLVDELAVAPLAAKRDVR